MSGLRERWQQRLGEGLSSAAIRFAAYAIAIPIEVGTISRITAHDRGSTSRSGFSTVAVGSAYIWGTKRLTDLWGRRWASPTMAMIIACFTIIMAPFGV